MDNDSVPLLMDVIPRVQAEPRQKQELDTIEARKFDRSSSDEYVDFEELPKE